MALYLVVLFLLPFTIAKIHDPRCIICNGTNAEAYWSANGKQLSLQRIPPNSTHNCDIIYTANADGTNLKRQAPLEGRDTCSYFAPNGYELYYSSTKSAGKWCPPTPDMNFGYVWPIYPSMNIYKQNLKTMEIEQLTNEQGYNAELTVSPNGEWAIFTSSRSGDLELYSFPLNDSLDVRRLTYTPGYDGGAYYSNDNSMIAWRAYRPQGDNLTLYYDLIKLGIVNPAGMQLYVANYDGSDSRMIAELPGTNFAPFFLPDDSGLIFSSNTHDPESGDFQLYTINLDGTNLTQLTTKEEYGIFNSFPMFSPDGKKLAWASAKNAKEYGDIYIYVADWIV